MAYEQSEWNVWFEERFTDDVFLRYKINRVIHQERTEYQNLAVIETPGFGRALILDGITQTTDRDEFIYHEMMAHPPLLAHPNPRRVLVIGGGDGGVVREVVKHKTVEHVDLVDIDRRVVEISRQYFPAISCGLDDPRVSIYIMDGIKFAREFASEGGGGMLGQNNREKYDVAIVDSTDPTGPGTGLFEPAFHADLAACLKDDGILVVLGEAPFFVYDLFKSIFDSLAGVFPITKTYLATVPTYSAWYWAFTVGSKKHDPAVPIAPMEERLVSGATTRYYTAAVHRAAFALPKFLEEQLYGEHR